MHRLLMGLLLAMMLLGGVALAKDGGDVAPDSASIRPLLIGARAPDLVLATGEGKPFDLNQAFGRKPTVLILYRGGW